MRPTKYSMMRNLYTFILLLFLLPATIFAQTGCPGCTVSLPALPLDTIFLEEAPDGMLFAPYDEDISFRLPITTNPVHDVDPETPAGIDIDAITITSVENLPFGLSWETNQSTFDIAAGQTDGCVKICGTPEEYGTFEVDVVLSAQILFLNQTTSFSFQITILPNTVTTDGFTVSNTEGCGEVVAAFINNVPSGNQEGFEYLWDFGNGFLSSLESPDTVVYDEPGDYEVTFRAIIDTAAYYLDEVKVLSSDCSDVFGGRPDVYVEVKDPDGTLIYTSGTYDNVDFPATYNTHVKIEEGTYTLRVIDNDSGINGGDDLCGEISFTQNDNGFFDAGSMTLTIDITHRIDTVTSSEIIHVFALPEALELTGTETAIDCEGETAILSTTSTENIQWQLNGAAIIGETGQELEAVEPGIYTCVYTSDEGCSVISPEFNLESTPFDVVVAFEQIGNYYTLADPAQLDGYNYEAQWYLNNQLIEDANELGYCIQISGTYKLVITNTDTHCSLSSEILAFYDEGDPNCITGTNDVDLLEVEVYPNPFDDYLSIRIPSGADAAISYKLYNQLGQLLTFEQQTDTGVINVAHLSAGVYFLEVIFGGKSQVVRVIKTN